MEKYLEIDISKIPYINSGISLYVEKQSPYGIGYPKIITKYSIYKNTVVDENNNILDKTNFIENLKFFGNFCRFYVNKSQFFHDNNDEISVNTEQWERISNEDILNLRKGNVLKIINYTRDRISENIFNVTETKVVSENEDIVLDKKELYKNSSYYGLEIYKKKKDNRVSTYKLPKKDSDVGESWFDCETECREYKGHTQFLKESKDGSKYWEFY